MILQGGSKYYQIPFNKKNTEIFMVALLHHVKKAKNCGECFLSPWCDWMKNEMCEKMEVEE